MHADTIPATEMSLGAISAICNERRSILDEQANIVGACDIKSNRPSGTEIGYRLSRVHSGTMTPAVGAMIGVAKQLGLEQLIA